MSARHVTVQERGFTLIELLIVIAIIGFLAAAILVAVDPVKRIQDSRDARRFSESNALLNAILTKQVDDNTLFGGLASAPIVTSATKSQVITAADNGVDCSIPADAPLCPTVTLATTASKDCVANLGGTMAGTASTSGGVLLTGISTDFAVEASVGDILQSASGSSCTIASIGSSTSITCTGTPSPNFAGALFNTSKSIVPNYIASAPIDPRGAGVSMDSNNLPFGTRNSGYYIHRTNSNRIEIGSCYPEQESTISVKR
jgi:prepilin-type N-terminal cleavage/methylation domain-containing protein